MCIVSRWQEGGWLGLLRYFVRRVINVSKSHNGPFFFLLATQSLIIIDWNIMNNSAMTTIAAQVPTSMEELSDLGILGENVVNDYGERLVRNISSFVQQEKLEKYLERRAAKRPKVAGGTSAAAASSSTAGIAGKAPKGVGKENEDFDAGIDFSAIDLPTGNNAGAANAAGGSAGAASSAAPGAKKAGKRSSGGGGTKSSYF